jgi:myo-inositol-1(or 4)-monophosphatase
MNRIKSISNLIPVMREAGKLAMDYFGRPAAQRKERKADRSFVTEADKGVEAFLTEAISRLYPGCNIIGEEKTRITRAAPEGTFAIDPLDGTSAFTLGLPGWSIVAGFLDPDARPRGGVVYSPAWDGLFFADTDPSEPLMFNNRPVVPRQVPAEAVFEADTNILLDSKFHRRHYLKDFPGKVRCYGSTALHLCLTALQVGPAVTQAFACHVWDLAAAHAIVLRAGGIVEYQDGDAIDYRELSEGQKAPQHILGGPGPFVRRLRDMIRPLPS